MKTLLLAFLLASCSSNKKLAENEFKKGDTFYAIKDAKKDPPSKCTYFQTSYFCQWYDKTLWFKNNILESEITHGSGTGKYALAMETVKGKDAPEKTIYLKQWNKNADVIGWRNYSPLIKAILIENGFTVVEKPEEAQQMLRVSFGVQEMSGGNLRYLNFNSIDAQAYLLSKKESSYWKAKISSWGTGRQLDQVLPIMMVPVDGFLKNPETKNSSPVVDEASFEVLVFKKYFGIN